MYTKKINISCNKDCGGGCPLTAHIENNKIVRITNNELSPKYFTGCPRGFLFQKVLYSNDRIISPLIRTGKRGDGIFEAISWKKALEVISDTIQDIISKYGTQAILPFAGSGSCRGIMHNTELLSNRFFSMLGKCTWPYGNYSSAAVSYATPFVLGTKFSGIDPLTLKHSKLVILWGADISTTRFDCQIENILLELKLNGIPIIVIDPRESRTVKKLSTNWIQINPGTDTVLMSAIAYVLIKENFIDNNFINNYTVGFQEYCDYILGSNDNIPKKPEWAANICGIPSSTIRDFALQYALSKPTALIPGLSIQRTIGWEETSRAAIILQTLTGNIGLKGGSSGGKYWSSLPKPQIATIFDGNIKSKFSFPVYQWPDAILNKKPTEIKLIYNIGTNLLNQGSDIHKNINALNRLDFVVTHDSFLTPTARYSDIILPTTMWPERNDVVSCSNNYLFYSKKAVVSPPLVKNDYTILSELSRKLGFHCKFTENRTGDEWINYFLEKSEINDIDNFIATGIYEGKEQERVACENFIKNPKEYPLNTPSGLIEISSEQYALTGFPAIPVCRDIKKNSKYPLILITPHAKFRINSSNANIDYFNRLEDDTIWVNIKDALARSIKNNSLVKVFNQRGSITVKAKITDAIKQGTVSLNQGVWIKFSKVKIDSAPNILTSTSPTLPSYGSRTHMTFVQVKTILKDG